MFRVPTTPPHQTGSLKRSFASSSPAGPSTPPAHPPAKRYRYSPGRLPTPSPERTTFTSANAPNAPNAPPLAHLSIPRALPRLPTLPTVPQANLEPLGLAHVPASFVRHTLRTKSTLPSRPTHTLRVKGTQYTFQIDALRYAPACAYLPVLPRSSASSEELPVVELSLPNTNSFALFDHLLHHHQITWRAPPAGQSATAGWVCRVGALHGVWAIVVTLGLADEHVWDRLESMWDETVRGLERAAAEDWERRKGEQL